MLLLKLTNNSYAKKKGLYTLEINEKIIFPTYHCSVVCCTKYEFWGSIITRTNVRDVWFSVYKMFGAKRKSKYNLLECHSYLLNCIPLQENMKIFINIFFKCK